MKERILKDYFLNKTTVDLLAIDLKDGQNKTGFDTTTVTIEHLLESGEFEITIDYLIRLCDAVINGKLTMTDLNTIAFALITSEYFTWDSDSTDGKRIETVICDWDNPEIGFDLTVNNVKLWKDYLLTGVYKFDNKSLKQKK
ncbi:MAG: hypothetical protein JW866_10355 [Ignavibacteriales bacterium]|nr:hypothetical protein [Ignavibacteriales bacterium]